MRSPTLATLLEGTVVSCRKEGVADNGTDCTAALQAAVNKACSIPGGKLLMEAPRGTSRYSVRDTIVVQPQDGSGMVQLNVEAFLGTNSINWEGADNKPVFQTLGLNYSTWRGLSVRLKSGTTGVTVFDIDDPAADASSHDVTFISCGAFFNSGTVSCIAWRVGHGNTGSGADVSWINWYTCWAEAGTRNGHIGWSYEHQNVLNLQLYGCNTYYMDVGWTNIPTTGAASANGGNGIFYYGCGSSHNAVDFQHAGIGALGIFGGRFEVGKRFLDVTSGGNSVACTVSCVEIGAYTPADNIVMLFNAAGSSLTLDNVSMYYDGGTNYTNPVRLQASKSSLFINGGQYQTGGAAIYSLTSSGQSVTMGAKPALISNSRTWSADPPRPTDDPTTAGLRESIRASLVDADLTVSTGVLTLVGPIRLQPGDRVSGIRFVSGATASTSITNQWAAVVRADTRGVVSKATDQTTTAWGANTARTFTLSSTYIPGEDRDVYLALMLNGSGLPSIVGQATKPGFSAITPVQAATADTGLTNPASLGATAATLTGIASRPYAAAILA